MIQVKLAQLVKQDLKVQKGRLVQLVRLAHKVLRESKVSKEFKDLLAQMEKVSHLLFLMRIIP